MEHNDKPATLRDVLMAYFLRPFPKAQGFSPYRSPGLLVHIPAVVLAVLVAVFVWGDHLTIWILVIHFVIGLYVGRDLAILAHYTPLLTLLVLAALAAFVVWSQAAAGLASALNHAFPFAPWVVTAVLIIAFIVNLWFWCRRM